MSMHKIPLTPIEESGLRAHGLDIGKPSQLSDAFRQGVRYASAQLPSQGGEAGELEAERITVVSITGIIQAVAATDYDSLKAERDRLQKELADLHSARSAPAERVEVVGYAGLNQLELHRLLPKYPGMKVKKDPGERYTEPLMTVAQHQRILAATTHPADQVADDLTMVKVPRELLEEIVELHRRRGVVLIIHVEQLGELLNGGRDE